MQKKSLETKILKWFQNYSFETIDINWLLATLSNDNIITDKEIDERYNEIEAICNNIEEQMQEKFNEIIMFELMNCYPADKTVKELKAINKVNHIFLDNVHGDEIVREELDDEAVVNPTCEQYMHGKISLEDNKTYPIFFDEDEYNEYHSNQN